MTEGAPAATLRRRLGRAFVVVFVLVAVCFTGVVLFLNRYADLGTTITARWTPAYTTSTNLLSDLVNQETGVRGYALSGDTRSLQPYTQYAAQERSDTAQLQRLMRGQSQVLTELSDFTAATDTWRRTVATPLIELGRHNDPRADQVVGSAQAQARFDDIRKASASLTGVVTGKRQDIINHRYGILDLVWWAVGVMGAVLLLAAVVLWRGLRRTVLEPIESLAAQARVIARGEIDRTIVADGPPEITGLGADVDWMRARIVEELQVVERARAAVEARGEELARSNADLEQFAYVASHDLSEPLRKVANFCQLLERQYSPQLDDKARQYIHFAVDGAKRMQILINDLLAFSRVGRTSEEFVPVDLNVTLDRALSNLDDRIRDAGATVERDRLPTVPGDPSLLTALFQNLVGNAVKYRGEAAPVVHVRVQQVDANWQFTVSDNGIGIDDQYAERIFAIFQRLHLRDQYGGTGIGLALCRRIVEFHNGRIWLEPNQDPGATFAFTLPDSPQVDQTGPARVRAFTERAGERV